MMNVLLRLSHILRRSGKPQPWCSRRLSELAAVKGYWAALTTCSAFSVGKCGRFAVAVAAGVAQLVAEHAVREHLDRQDVVAGDEIGVAPEVPPKPPVSCHWSSRHCQ